MTVTDDEKVQILAHGDDLLEKLYRDSESARNAAWRKHLASQESDNGTTQAVNPEYEHPTDVIPEDERPEEWQEEDLDIETLLDGVDIIDAYRRWCGKSDPDPRGKREGIMISCPNPAHPDKDPSAWINLDKQVWVCGGCGFEGGDKYDIAAWHFGYPVPGYKTGKNFPDLRRDMASELGYVTRKTKSGQEYLVQTEEPTSCGVESDSGDVDGPVESEAVEEIPISTAPLSSDDSVWAMPPPPDFLTTGDFDLPPDRPDATVTHLFGEPDPIPEPIEPINLDLLRKSSLFVDWESWGLDGTFLGDYMTSTCVDHVPDEYNLWMAFQCLGFASQMNVLMDDDMSLVKPGLYVVLYGDTGIGKSRSISPMHEVLQKVLPWPDYRGGVQRIGTPGSGEALIDATTAKSEISGGSTPEEIEPTNVWLNSDEFGTLTAIANRKGSTLKTALMEFYDLVKGAPKNSVMIYSRSHGSVSAKNKFFQVTSTVQPKVIGKYMTDMDVMSGFLNRWIFVMGDGRRNPSPRPPRKDVSSAIKRLIDVRDWAETEYQVEMTPGAFNIWAEFYNDIIMPAVKRSMKIHRVRELNDSNTDSFTARTELTLKKLCLLFAINEQCPEVQERHVLLATHLASYLRSSMIQLSTDFAWTFATEVEEAVLNYLQRKHDKKDGPVRMRQITDALKNRFTRTDINKSVQILIDVGAVNEIVAKGKRGPTGVAYVLAVG